MRLTPGGKPLLRAGLVALAGAGYYLFAAAFGGLPCPFRLVTGFKCPGCGITTMILRLGRGDLAGAFWANPVQLATLPLLIGLILRQGWLRAKGRRFGRWENTLCLIYAAGLLAWGVVRNFAGL